MTAVAVRQEGLEPLRTALLERASREAEELVGAAEAEGRRAITTAQRQVEDLVETARELGHTEGTDLRALELAAARRRGRARTLATQRDLYEEIRQAARHTVLEIVGQDRSRRRLAAVLRARLGGSAAVHDTPDGGLMAVAEDGRTIDASVGSLADAALERLDLGQLWTTR
jgi:vacuolar-type H+-ATPase subunit E/Vma4